MNRRRQRDADLEADPDAQPAAPAPAAPLVLTADLLQLLLGRSHFKVEIKLEGTANYGAWKNAVRQHLQNQGLWPVTTSSRNEWVQSGNQPQVWDENNIISFGTILGTLSPALVNTFGNPPENERTGHNLWLKLQRGYELSNTDKIRELYQSLNTLQFKDSPSVAEFLVKLEHILDSLRAAGPCC